MENCDIVKKKDWNQYVQLEPMILFLNVYAQKDWKVILKNVNNSYCWVVRLKVIFYVIIFCRSEFSDIYKNEYATKVFLVFR